MSRATVAEGDVAPLYVRVRSVYRPQGIATVLIALPGGLIGAADGWGQRWEQRVVALDSLGEPCGDLSNENREWIALAPRRFW